MSLIAMRERMNSNYHELFAANLVVIVRLARTILVDCRQSIQSIDFILLRLPRLFKHRLLGVDRNPHSMATVRCKAIGSTVVGGPVIPECDIILAP